MKKIEKWGGGEATANHFALGVCCGERQIPAVARTGYHHLRLVEIGSGRDPIEERADIFDRILTFASIVEMSEGLAEPFGAADIGKNDGNPQVVEEVVAPSLKTRSL